MNEGKLSIGKMAEINHTTVATLRLYDKEGLLHPCYTDPSSGYRYYNIRQNARLDMIQYMKELGMSLSEIGNILRKEDLGLIEEILRRKKIQADGEIAKIELQKNAIDRTMESISRYRRSPGSGTRTLEYIHDRRVYAIPASINFYDYDLDTYEMLLKELKEKLIGRNLPQIYFCNAGTSITKDDFQNQSFTADQIFVFVDDTFPLLSETTVFEGGMYACIYLNNYDHEKEYAARLLAYCRENGYQIAGDYICEVLTEFNIFDSSRRSMFLRLQVPVSFENDLDSHPA
ncbi:MAG: MerR family transcriptional regulator [Eubacteriaceae bacterium]|jgi:DNA-binding transcriptional MerR regulator